MEKLHQLLYTSAAIRVMSDKDINDIVKVSLNYNSKHNITGLLVYYNREFMQLLEGEKDAIFKLYNDRIFLDDRHVSIHIVNDSPIQERSFKDWSIAVKNLDTVAPPFKKHFSDFLQKGFTKSFTSQDLTTAQKLMLSLKNMI